MRRFGASRENEVERRWRGHHCRATTAAFSADLPGYARCLRRALREGNVAAFAVACKVIRDFAHPLGFRNIASAADEAVRCVRRTRSLDRSHEEVAVLAMLCDRARAA